MSRVGPFGIACAPGSAVFGYSSTGVWTIREPLGEGFSTAMGGVIGFAAIQPGQSVNAAAFACVAGFGFGAILVVVVIIIIIVVVQLNTRHHLIPTATAIQASTWAFSATVFIAICAIVVHSRRERSLLHP